MTGSSYFGRIGNFLSRKRLWKSSLISISKYPSETKNVQTDLDELFSTDELVRLK